MSSIPSSFSEDSTIELTEDKYEISNPIKIKDDNTIIEGNGAVLSCETLSETPIQICDGATNAIIRNVKITLGGGTADKKINGIEVRESSGTTIDSCSVTGSPQVSEPGSIEAIGGGSGICIRQGASRTSIKNCTTISCGWRGIEVGGTATTIESCSALSQGDRGISGDVQLPNTGQEFDEYADQLCIEDCFARGGPHPAAPIGFSNARNVRIQNCMTQSSSGRRGIAARSSVGVTIENCDLVGDSQDPQEGIYTSSTNIDIHNNSISGFRYGIRIAGDNTQAYSNRIDSCTIGIMKRSFRNNKTKRNQSSNIIMNKIRQKVHEARLFGRRVI